jgi:[acyl-carrier-protein] S-malonyltransferase
MTTAFVFPGQGSQSVGMLAAFAQQSPLIEATFAEASLALDYDLWAVCRDGPPEVLNVTERTQPAMLAAGVAMYRLWRERGGAVPRFMAGHSVGEFSALVAAGSLDFKTAVALVRFRAEAMQNAVPTGQGAMAAILGLDDAEVEAACATGADGEVVEAVNYNSPGQVVIAGHATAVARAVASATARGAKHAVMLPISVPAHSSLMRPAAERLRERLAAAPIAAVAAEVVLQGVDGRRLVTPDEVRAGVVKQLHTPVHWAATVRALIAAGATRIVECGPGKVLTGLNRRIDKNKDVQKLALEDPESLDRALAAER